ncbi:hypothetical protein NDU88_001912 [Pleurodeles waltl]|uniref:Uncharacterized protein n=1 Tax=Pleurodeles waltl TaxID=8319 RepID=A0AAV7T198_PLEWA|nr:hypothetical protein NDU88_001912 [Pleurodeles waltl]
MCVNPGVEGYAVALGEEEKTLKETSGIFGQNGSTEKEDARPESRGVTQQKTEGTNRKFRATEETREAEPSAKDETRQENANTPATSQEGRGYYRCRGLRCGAGRGRKDAERNKRRLRPELEYRERGRQTREQRRDPLEDRGDKQKIQSEGEDPGSRAFRQRRDKTGKR